MDFPRVKTSSKSKLATSMTGVWIWSTFRYMWRDSGFGVELSIGRRWRNIEAMRGDPSVETRVTIYGERQGQGKATCNRPSGADEELVDMIRVAREVRDDLVIALGRA